MQKLRDKVVLVTGGTSGIGLASARLFKKHGARLIMTGREEAGIASAQGELGADTLVLRSEASALGDIAALVEQARQRFGRIDVLFLNAGVATAAPIEATTEALYDQMMDVNVKGPFFTIQHALPLMEAGGSIVVTTSIGNQIGMANFSVYAATKAALRSLVQSLGLEMIGRGIRVNAISPGPIATQIHDRFGLPSEIAQAVKADITARSPSKRFGTPDEVARLALFLASDDSSYIVGEEIVIDGGMTLL